MSREDRGDGRKLSFSERDRLRREGADRRTHTPRGEKAQERSREATSAYLHKAESKLFSKSKGGSEQDALTKALRAAYGTSELAAACQAYRDALGMPKEAALLALFLDSRDPELIREALEVLVTELDEVDGNSLKSQLRILSFHQDAQIAELAEEILEQL